MNTLILIEIKLDRRQIKKDLQMESLGRLRKQGNAKDRK